MILYIYCAGGFGKEVLDVARRRNDADRNWDDIKFVDDSFSGNFKYSSEVVKFSEISTNLSLGKSEFLIANGEPSIRKKILEKLNSVGANMGKLIDTSAIFAASAKFSDGILVAPLCSISSDAVLMKNSCVNTMSIIGHDVSIGENSVISSMVNMGGGCIVGDNSYVGMGALIKEGVNIGSNSIIGMGSVLYSDIPDGVIALGNPARVVRNNTDQKVFKQKG